MAISRIATANAMRWDLTSSSLTYSFTTSGKNRFLVVGITTLGPSNLVTGVTYAGETMWQVAAVLSNNSDPKEYGYMYYLINPTLGANNVVISCSGNAWIASTAILYGGVLQGGNYIDDTETRTTVGTMTLTTTEAGDWIVATSHSPDYGGYTELTAINSSESHTISDSAGIVSKGNNTITLTTGGLREACGIAMAFKASPVQSGSPMFLSNGGLVIG